MSEITLELDKKMTETMNILMDHYNVKKPSDLIYKALLVLNVAAKNGGHILTKIEDKYTKIRI